MFMVVIYMVSQPDACRLTRSDMDFNEVVGNAGDPLVLRISGQRPKIVDKVCDLGTLSFDDCVWDDKIFNCWVATYNLVPNPELGLSHHLPTTRFEMHLDPLGNPDRVTDVQEVDVIRCTHGFTLQIIASLEPDVGQDEDIRAFTACVLLVIAMADKLTDLPPEEFISLTEDVDAIAEQEYSETMHSAGRSGESDNILHY